MELPLPFSGRSLPIAYAGRIGEVQTGGGFVQDIQGAAGVAFGAAPGQLHPLGFAAGRGWWRFGRGGCSPGRRPSGFAVCAPTRGHGVEEFQGVLDGHVQHLADVFAFVLHFQGFAGCSVCRGRLRRAHTHPAGSAFPP